MVAKAKKKNVTSKDTLKEKAESLKEEKKSLPKNEQKSSEKIATVKSDKIKKNSKPKKENSIKKWFKEVISEFKKVRWPNKKEMIKYSIATIVFILFFALFFYIIEVIIYFINSAM